MKKVFTTAAMTMVAFTAVVTMSSCQNDSPSSFNASPVVTGTVQTSEADKKAYTPEYTYQAAVSNDMLDYFDIIITRTAGSEVKTYTFTKNTMMGQYAAMQTELDTFKSPEHVTFKATVKAKANWKDVYKQNGEKKPVFGVVVNCSYKGFPRNTVPSPTHITEMSDESIQTIALTLESKLKVDC